MKNEFKVKLTERGKEVEYTLDQIFNCHELGMRVAFDTKMSVEAHIDAIPRLKKQIKEYVKQLINQKQPN